jgi:hypothetical protein
VSPEWGRVLDICAAPPPWIHPGISSPATVAIIQKSKHPKLGCFDFLMIATVAGLEIPGWIHKGGDIYIYIYRERERERKAVIKKSKYPVIIYVTMVLSLNFFGFVCNNGGCIPDLDLCFS